MADIEQFLKDDKKAHEKLQGEKFTYDMRESSLLKPVVELEKALIEGKVFKE